ncbi:MAG: uracil-DNA glycosylase [Candidatus Sulfotelmatobacter sp.]
MFRQQCKGVSSVQEDNAITGPAMTTLSNRLEKNWLDIIGVAFDMAQLERFLQNEKDAGYTVYPKDQEIFSALNSTAFSDIKVVLIGQDPYHGEGQAHGLCFSVPKDIREKRIPPSLRNIYKEIEREDDSIKMPPHGDLTGWAKQGVLLLNATLTVREGRARSHQGKGWEEFTDAIIRAVNEKRHVVFLLWGSYARKKRALINPDRHRVLEASHPSPRSACRGSIGCHSFVDCGHFKDTNRYLLEHGLEPIKWQKI